MQIGVLGGTGKVGKFIITELLNKGYSVRMLARNPEALGIKNDLLHVITGNARSLNSIQRLLTGCDAVISALGNSKKETDTCSTAVGHVIKVMRELKISRYLEIAGIGIDTPDDRKGFRTKMINGILNLLFHAVIYDRQKGYQLLKDSHLEWTIIRCPGIETTGVKMPIKISLHDVPGFKVSASGLADFIITELTGKAYIRKCPFIGNA